MTTFLFPIAGSYRETQKFGEDLLNYGQFGLKGHNGMDFAAWRGTMVVAPSDGWVIESTGGAVPGAGGYGNVVRLLCETDDANLYKNHVFGHFLTVFPSKGDRVLEGDDIGLIDSTGFSTGDHLHWGVRNMRRLAANERAKHTKTYEGTSYSIENYENGYFGYYDFETEIEGYVDVLLNVDLRYGQEYSWIRESRWNLVHKAYAIKRAKEIGSFFDDGWWEKAFKGFVYGYWDVDTIIDPALFALWTEMTKPEFEMRRRSGQLLRERDGTNPFDIKPH